MPKVIIPTIILINFLLLIPSAYAATVSLSNVPASLNDDQEFTISVAVSGAAANTTNYLRAAFYSEVSPTSYFGYTFNHLGNWYNGSPSPIDPHQFLQIQIGSDGTWSGELKAKVDTQDTDFKGSGNYYFKVGRYTASGGSVSDWSGSTLVSITATTPSRCGSPSPSPSPTQSPSTKSTKSESSTKSPSHTPKSPQASNKSPSPQAQSQGQTTKTQQATVLGQKQESTASSTPNPSSSPSASPSPTPQAQNSNKTKIAAYLAGSGLIVIGLSIGLFLWYHRTLKKKDTDES